MKYIATLVLTLFLAQPLLASDYYWINGTGNFSDISHWVTTSGGSTNYSVVPGADDNVIFDNNSFSTPGQTINITTNAVCRDMTWKSVNAPVFTCKYAQSLRIFGSLRLHPSMTVNLYTPTYFESTSPGCIIDMAGKYFQGNVTFRGIGGSYTLLGDLNIHNNGNVATLDLQAGTLNTNNFALTCDHFNSTTTFPCSLVLGNSVITVQNLFFIKNSNVTLSCGNSVIYLTGKDASFNAGTNLSFNRVVFLNDTSYLQSVNGNSFIHSLIFHSNGQPFGNLSFDTLVFKAGKSYNLSGISVLNINDYWGLTGTCTSPINIYSSPSGMNCTVHMSSGNVMAENVILKDVWATGGAVFTAMNSLDLGNNNGWTITTPAPAKLYWVNNGGNWNDSLHWSHTSGGSGGACPPTPYDSVRFDENSFSQPGQTVLLNQNSAYVKNMDWTGVSHHPLIKASESGNELKIYGSLLLDSAMTYAFQGITYFESADMGNIIRTRGNTINRIKINGSGSWILDDNLSAGVIYFEYGSFSSNHKRINCRYINAADDYNAQPAMLDFTSSVIHTGGLDLYGLSPLHFQCGTSVLYLDGSSFYTNNQKFNRVVCSGGVEFLMPAIYTSLILLNDAYGVSGVFDTLVFSAGYSYSMENCVVNQYLSMNGNCMNRIILSGGSTTHFSISTGTIIANYLIMTGIPASGGAGFIANNSVDLGGNTGWTINSSATRNLYWVNNGGNWSDSTHWSLSSNGPGGECIPMPGDNVFFDQFSFTAAAQSVVLDDAIVFCHNMSWAGVQHMPSLTLGPVNSGNQWKIYGSLNLDSAMIFTGNYGSMDFASNDTGNTIKIPFAVNASILFTGWTGKWDLNSGLNTSRNIQFSGGGKFNTRGYTIRCSGFSAWDGINVTAGINLDTSRIYCGGFALNGMVDVPLTNYILFVKQGVKIYHDTINRVVFTTPSPYTNQVVLGTNSHFKSIRFYGSGEINGTNTIDTLFLVTGSSYLFSAGDTQTVNKMTIRGNNCNPLVLHSSSAGTLATLSMPAGIVSGDFLELKDIEATGGASFYAGHYSTDLGNNPGWIWSNAPGYVYGFPTDTSFCAGSTLLLTTENFNGGIAWLWQDGSTGPDYAVTQPGVYSVKVSYSASCYVRDTIHVAMKPVPDALITPPSQYLCSQGMAAFSITNPNNLPGTTFSWTASLVNASSASGFSDGFGNMISQTLYNTGISPAGILYTVTPHSAGCAGAPVSATAYLKVPASNLDGHVHYDNATSTPLTNSKIYLKNAAGILVDSATTDITGHYQFCDIPGGSYKLFPTTSIPWGGVNAADAMITLSHYVGLAALSGLPLLAADINNSGYINASDALQIARRYVGMVNAFSIPDWLFEQPEFSLFDNTSLTISMLGLCAGDVNRSYIPVGGP